MAGAIMSLPSTMTLDQVRGCEGIAAQAYFSVFDSMIRVAKSEFAFDIRSRRPPRDRMNALLSFLYSIAASDCVAALEGVGLDPQLGYLHAMRSGRPGLALDLVEEFRAVIQDRLALSLVNRKQITSADFEEREGGSWFLNADGRKKVLAALQKRKAEEVRHDLFKEKIPIGLLPHVQARILARCLRNDIPGYLPYMPK
jgi:CRISPR-associated protein Cas1